MSQDFSALIPPSITQTIDEWIREDIPSIDRGAFVVGTQPKKATLFAKSNLVLAGVPFFDLIFKKFNVTVDWKYKEGSYIEASNKSRVPVATLSGRAKDILQGERLALNVITRCCSIATNAKLFTDEKKKHNFKGSIAGTRKTTPGFRLAEKYSLLVGGCDTHRWDLSSMLMIKDNHIDACGSITKAVEKGKLVAGFSTMIEVECRSLEDAFEAAKAGAHVVMLDNFGPEKSKIAAKEFKKKFPNVIVEVSGGIRLNDVSDYFCDEVDVISVGGLIQGVPYVDLSLKIEQQKM